MDAATGVGAEMWARLNPDEKLALIYRQTLFVHQEVLELKRYVVELEQKADAMTSPEAMQKMVGSFMGGGLFS
jgi:hypothetical protein